MTGLFTLLFIGSIVGLIVGLKNPSKAIFWGKAENKTKGKVKKVYISMLVISFIMIGAFSPNEKEIQKGKVSETSQEKEKTTDYTKDTMFVAFAKNVNSYDANGNKINIEAKTRYEIIKGEALNNIKYTYDVRLSNNKLTKEELKQLAKSLKNDLSEEYDKIFICYYLPNDKVDAGAWATSHFTPELNVAILGVTAEAEKKMKKVKSKSNEKIIGKWAYKGNVMYVMFKRNKRTYLAMRTATENAENRLHIKVVNGERRYIEDGNTTDYFIIAKNGNLKVFDYEYGFFEEYKSLQ